MMIHRPLVIVDEAHNARTGLTFDVLKRVAPSCIIELTATPDTDPRTGSNILHRVSASELKAEALIKLPIVLIEHPTGWQDAVRDALLTRQRLAELAAREAEYIRPLLLIQAENRDKPANVDAVKQYLIDDEKVAVERIAIATGDQRELDGINLFDSACPIEVIITVQALKEGWDCSFAYVFCSTANISASRDVEQLLGRVLRMPYARRRLAPDLNKAYAHVASASFGQAARELEDSLINRMGFEETEAAGAIEQAPQPELFDDLPLFMQPASVTLTVDRLPDLSGLSPEEQAAVVVHELAPGNVQVQLRGEITPQLAERIEAAVPGTLRPVLREQMAEYQVSRGQASEPVRRERFVVPRLCVFIQGELELAERELFLDAAGWNLLDCPAELADFRFNDSSEDVRVRRGRQPRGLPVQGRSAARAAARHGSVDGERPGALARQGAAPGRYRARGPASLAPAWRDLSDGSETVRFAVAGTGQVHPRASAGRENSRISRGRTRAATRTSCSARGPPSRRATITNSATNPASIRPIATAAAATSGRSTSTHRPPASWRPKARNSSALRCSTCSLRSKPGCATWSDNRPPRSGCPLLPTGSTPTLWRN